MQCPKCHGSMRTYERNGVHIEQCDNCRGIFLDYGELETLSRMEMQYHS
ncbi:zf-TFIIB domain-containing protein, partial [Nonomuraea diastatica]